MFEKKATAGVWAVESRAYDSSNNSDNFPIIMHLFLIIFIISAKGFRY